jgi:DnaJ-class molecular chaperone
MISKYYDKNGRIINFYKIFNIEYDAKIAEIKSAFHSLIKLYHPDTAKKFTELNKEKIELIIRAYRILSNKKTRLEYNRLLVNNNKNHNHSQIIIPYQRVKYSTSLKNIFIKNFLPKKIKRKNLISKFGQDIEILITPNEALLGAIAYIELPASMLCPVCTGTNPDCYVCEGLGKINTSAHLEINIAPQIKNGTKINISLTKLKPDNYTTFKSKEIIIKITIL